MGKLPFVIYLMAAPFLMGALVLTVLVVPELSARENSMIWQAALLGAVLAMPVSYGISKIIKNKIK